MSVQFPEFSASVRPQAVPSHLTRSLSLSQNNQKLNGAYHDRSAAAAGHWRTNERTVQGLSISRDSLGPVEANKNAARRAGPDRLGSCWKVIEREILEEIIIGPN